MRTKLQRAYAKARNLQHDIVSKYTTYLVEAYDTIVIEDFAVLNLLALVESSLVEQYIN